MSVLDSTRHFKFQARESATAAAAAAASNRTEFCLNQYKSTKYTWWNFLPKNLFEQFRRLANIFFLLVALLAFIPNASNIQPGAAIIPISLVLTFTAVKDLYEDLKRARADARINSRRARVVYERSIEQVEWKDVECVYYFNYAC